MVSNTARLYNQLPPLLEQASLSSRSLLANNTVLASAVSTNPQPFQDTFESTTAETTKPLVTSAKQQPTTTPAINLILTGISMVVAASAVGITLFQGHQYNKRLKELVIPPAEGGVNAALQSATLLKQAEQTASNAISTVEQALLAQIEALKQTHQQELQTLIANFEQQKNSLQQHATHTTNTATQALEANIAQLTQQHQQQIEALTLQLNTLSKEQATQLQEKVEALNNQLAGLQHQLATTEQQLNTATSQHQEELMERTQQHQAELTTLKQEFEQVQTAHQAQLTGLTNQLTQLEEKSIQTAEGLQTQVVAQQEQLATLSATIDTLHQQQFQDILNQQHLERLENRIKELEKTLSFQTAQFATGHSNNTASAVPVTANTVNHLTNLEVEIDVGQLGYPQYDLLVQAQHEGYQALKSIFVYGNFEDGLGKQLPIDKQLIHPLTTFFNRLDNIFMGIERPKADTNQNSYSKAKETAYFKDIYVPTLQHIMAYLTPIQNENITQQRQQLQLDLALINLALKAYQQSRIDIPGLERMLNSRSNQDSIKQFALEAIQAGQDNSYINPRDLTILYDTLKSSAQKLVKAETPIRKQMTNTKLSLVESIGMLISPQ